MWLWVNNRVSTHPVSRHVVHWPKGRVPECPTLREPEGHKERPRDPFFGNVWVDTTVDSGHGTSTSWLQGGKKTTDSCSPSLSSGSPEDVKEQCTGGGLRESTKLRESFLDPGTFTSGLIQTEWMKFPLTKHWN